MYQCFLQYQIWGNKSCQISGCEWRGTISWQKESMKRELHHLKGSDSQYFRALVIFSQKISLGPVISALKYFEKCCDFAEICAFHNAKIQLSHDSAASLTLLSHYSTISLTQLRQSSVVPLILVSQFVINIS